VRSSKRSRVTNRAAIPRQRFTAAVEDYAAFHWQHMGCDEKELLPLAEKYLTVGDWKEIDAAFSGHTDPLLREAPTEDYRKLFRRIVNLGPPPIGVGPAG